MRVKPKDAKEHAALLRAMARAERLRAKTDSFTLFSPKDSLQLKRARALEAGARAISTLLKVTRSNEGNPLD